ncbi:hypothetical protein AB0H00_17835 [Nocardia sp. NPDC023852]|uniref:hypothetical protein n=1 Tax=Nocardia sp. NPDC023852 TaxID=3154697 RepID=UPI0033F3F531
MSRRRSPQPQQRGHSQVHAASRLIPVTELPHLAAAALRRGEPGRRVWVDDPEPQQVRTPGRRPGQWLGSGQRLRPAAPQYVTVAEIEQVTGDPGPAWDTSTSALANCRPGSSLADALSRGAEREGMDR